MLMMVWKSVIGPIPASNHTRADLEIRDLLDDPRLRRACGLDPATREVPVVQPHRKLRFTHRRRLAAAA